MMGTSPSVFHPLVMKPQLVKPDSQPEDGLIVRLNKPEKRKNYTVPLLIAAVVHIVVIGAIVLSLSGKTKPAPRANAPALRTAPQADVVPPAPVETAPSSSIAAPAAQPAAPKPIAKVAPKPVAKKAAIKPAKTTVSKKTAKTATAKVKAAQSKTAKAKAKPAPKKTPAPQKKAPVLDLEKLSKMGVRH